MAAGLKWLAAPQFEDTYQMFAGRVLHFTLLLLLTLTLTATVFITSPVQLIFIPVLLVLLGGCLYLLHTGRLRLAGILFLSGLWGIITLAAFSLNGVRNASIGSYALVIIFSAILISKRAVVVFTLVSMTAVITLAVGELAGVLPLRTTPLYLSDRVFQQLALFGSAGVLLAAASQVIRTSFERQREHEQLLLERNRALELEIAGHRQTEINLRKSEEKYRLLFENIPVMAAVYAQDGEIVLLNNATAHIFGGTTETLVGRNLRELIAPEDAELALKIQTEVIDSCKAQLIEGRVVLPHGNEVYFLRHVMPFPSNDQDGTSQVLVLTTDVTEKQRAEQRERELVAARERNAFMTEFFSTLSHDLKTPLTIMKTSFYLLQHAKTPQQRQARIDLIGEQVTLMDKFIQDMLTISRLEYLPKINFRTLDLNQLVEETLDLLRPRIEDKQLIHHFSPQPALPAIEGDPEQIGRMLTNLIENAINYTPTGGQIVVRTGLSDSQVLLEVQDSGIGIDAEALPKIFERFFRASEARSFDKSGTGLGLSIVKKIAETHAATIDVRSQPGKGTTFTVQFPALDVPSEVQSDEVA